MTKNNLQQLTGYLTGGLITLLLIPYGLFWASIAFDHLINIALIASSQIRNTLAICLLLPGIILGIWSNIILNRLGEGGPLEGMGIAISPRTKHLVVKGPYQYSRNPMLLGACMIYVAIAIYLNSISALAIVILFMVFMLVFVKLTEEKRLLKDFGKEYEEYRQNVSMFIPLPTKKYRSSLNS